MIEVLLVVILVLLVVSIVLHFVTLRKRRDVDLSPIEAGLTTSVDRVIQQTERAVRDEISQNRNETANASQKAREELSTMLQRVGTYLQQQLLKIAGNTDQQLNAMRGTIDVRLNTIEEGSSKKLDSIREQSALSARLAGEQVENQLKKFCDDLVKAFVDLRQNQHLQLTTVVEQSNRLSESTEKKLDAQRLAIDQKLQVIHGESANSDKLTREELSASLKNVGESLTKSVTDLSSLQSIKLDSLRTAVEDRLKAIHESNATQLDQMRQTVDEKLQGTLEKRLGEAFTQVSERLEQVHKGLGEMQSLATGVGDLKRVLTNVKSRGTWGEVQLGAMLEQVLNPEQFDKNVATKGSNERVEFAVKLPGKSSDNTEVVYLPIDAKFPIEDYQRLVEAQDHADCEAIEASVKQLENRIKSCARDICEKYINPPKTTDFAILYLPTEGLFAEAVRRVGLADFIQRECRVVIAGPTTLWSILNSLQMGFKTLTVQKRSSEVWTLLGTIKTEWRKYNDVLGEVQKKLESASNSIEKAHTRTRVLERKLSAVEEHPVPTSAPLLGLPALSTEDDPE